MIEPRLWPAHLEDRLGDRLVIEQIAEHLLTIEEPDEALRVQPGAGGGTDSRSTAALIRRLGRESASWRTRYP